MCDQVANVARSLVSAGPGLGLDVAVVKGGSMESKITNNRRRPLDILVGTMAALERTFAEGVYSRRRVGHVVLDEIDTLLDDTFSDTLVGFLDKFGAAGHGN